MRRLLITYRWDVLLVLGMPALAWGWSLLWIYGPVGFYSYDIYGINVIAWNAYFLLPALLMGVLYLRLRRRGYGWESVLLVAIPFWAMLSERGLVRILTDWDIPAQLVTVILLAALYPAVRRLGRGFLRLIWRFLLAVEIIGVVVDSLFLAMQLRGLDFVSDSAAWDAMLLGSLLTGPLAMFPLLRSIRQASRSSLAHAFFMVALGFSFPLRYLFEPAVATPPPELDYLALAALNITVRSLAIGMTIFTAWLLFNFDAWSPVFRRRAIAALFGVHALDGAFFSQWLIQGFALTNDGGVLLALTVIILAWLAAFWFIYLVRVRQPAGEAQPAAPGGR